MSRIDVFSEAEYAQRMKEEADPWFRSAVRMNQYHSYDGTRNTCYYAIHEDSAPKGSVVMVHGFTEYIGKYEEMMYYFYQAGYSVYFLEQRGHGRSGRKVEDPGAVYVRSFDEYVGDLRYLMDTIVIPKEPDTVKLLFCHSMGGAVGAMFLEEYPDDFRAAALSSPMIRINSGNTPAWQVKALSVLSVLLGWQMRTLPGSREFSGEDDFENSCSVSRARYERDLELRKKHRAYQTCNATYGWARAAMNATQELSGKADRIRIPVLLCQAGKETMVDNAAQDEFAERAGSALVVRFPEAKHEIFNSGDDTLPLYYETVISFFDEQSAR